VISDLFARNGGPNHYQTYVDTFVHIKSNNVIGDNFWLWRADHGVQGSTKSYMYPTQHGLIVDGDHVIMYGLAVEHTLHTLTTWNGDNGQTYFYQSELPYGVHQNEFGARGYVGYAVGNSVRSHKAVGIAVYSNFYSHNDVHSGITAPRSANIVSALTYHLAHSGVIEHVLNDHGSAVSSGHHSAAVCHGRASANATTSVEAIAVASEKKITEVDSEGWVSVEAIVV